MFIPRAEYSCHFRFMAHGNCGTARFDKLSVLKVRRSLVPFREMKIRFCQRYRFGGAKPGGVMC